MFLAHYNLEIQIEKIKGGKKIMEKIKITALKTKIDIEHKNFAGC